jgi:Tfp pilus assembly protein PilF
MPARTRALRGDRDGALALCLTSVQSPAGPPDLTEAGRVALELAVGSPTEATVLEKADAILKHALKQAPQADDLLVMNAMLNHIRGHFDEEVRLYRLALERRPRNAVVLNNLAWALSEGLHQPSEALDKIDEAIRYVGRQPNTLDTRGVILLRLGRYDQAIEELKGVTQAKATGVYYYHLAQAYHKAGREAEFRAALEQMRRAGVTLADVDSTERADFQALTRL